MPWGTAQLLLLGCVPALLSIFSFFMSFSGTSQGLGFVLAILLASAAPTLAQTTIRTDGSGSTISTPGAVISSKNGGTVISTPGATIEAGATRRRPSAKSSTAGTASSISTNNNRRTITCNGNDLTISGNHNQLTLLGTCGTLTLVGNDNVVQAATVRRLTIPGNRNQVHWTGPSPAVSNIGAGNVLGAVK